VRQKTTLTAAMHEDDAGSSGLREYRGPFYTYVHSAPLQKQDAKNHVTWRGYVYLHAKETRNRSNGSAWSDWQPVRTRVFISTTRTADGLGRWKCLIGAEIAWAEVTRQNDLWVTTPEVVTTYDHSELKRLLPVATSAQIDGTSPVAEHAE
jgi:hypothetical protein